MSATSTKHKTFVSRKDLQETVGDFDSKITVDYLRQELKHFAQERDWDQFHTPRNLLLALVGEVGELAELFQWKGDVGGLEGLTTFTDKEKVLVGEELSDVLLYLLRLSDRCHINLPQAALRKLRLNARKYPRDKARGRSAKYTEYVKETELQETVDMAGRFTEIRRRSRADSSSRLNDHQVSENIWRQEESDYQKGDYSVDNSEETTKQEEYDNAQSLAVDEQAEELSSNLKLVEESVLSIENMVCFSLGMGFMYLYTSGKIEAIFESIIHWLRS